MWPYAGITREVALVTENLVTIRKTLLRTSAGRLESAIVIANQGTESRRLSVELQCGVLTDKPIPIAIDIPAGGVRAVRIDGTLQPNAARWTPTTPSLHRVVARLRLGDKIVDEWTGNLGIRDFRVDGTRLLLNNRPIFLKGVAMYEETKSRGAALLPEDHRALLRLCRDAGANFIRLQVTQRSPEVYREADRQGFLLTGEWGGFWYREASMDAQTRDSRSVFQSHARCAIWDLVNHPSVALWCTHNESHQFCPEYGRFVAKATELVRELDWQRRPVSWAAWHPHMGQPEFRHADVVGFNEYRGAMDPFEKLEPDMRRVTTENPGKPLVILENGAWARPGKRGGVDEKDTEDWQATLLRRQHEVLVHHSPPLAGYTYWILVDYRSRKYYTANPESNGYSNMGLYGPDGRPKLVRDVFRDLTWPAK
jgi:beta-glucuronidase